MSDLAVLTDLQKKVTDSTQQQKTSMVKFQAEIEAMSKRLETVESILIHLNDSLKGDSDKSGLYDRIRKVESDVHDISTKVTLLGTEVNKLRKFKDQVYMAAAVIAAFAALLNGGLDLIGKIIHLTK